MGNNVLQCYYLYSTILAMCLLIPLSIATFVCHEDGQKIHLAHRNGLVSIAPFWMLSYIYTTTQPKIDEAVLLMRLYVAARIVTMYSLLVQFPEELKRISYAIAYSITIYMGVKIIMAYNQYL